MGLHGFTWVYMGLHGFTWVYLGLPGFTWVYQLPNDSPRVIRVCMVCKMIKMCSFRFSGLNILPRARGCQTRTNDHDLKNFKTLVMAIRSPH